RVWGSGLREWRRGLNGPCVGMCETTLHCNMKCGYCAIWQNQQPEDRAAREGFYTSMPTNGLALKKYAEACVKLDQLEVSIDTLDREKFAKRRGIDGLPTILSALDYIKENLSHNTIQVNAAVNLENLDDLPALAAYCEERKFLLHTEAVHNVV